MDLLLDIFGFASVLLSGVARTAQCLTLGGIAFLAFFAVPLDHGTPDENRLAPRTIQLTRIFARAMLITAGRQVSSPAAGLCSCRVLDLG